MEYILKEELSINKPLVFLCGPYYEEKTYDRRKILKDFLVNDFSKNVIPVIVDIFLSKEKIDDETIKIPLMEEICAAVSAKTYIFLDTFSAVAELGIFSSASHANNICVILPNYNDKLINNLNFFVTEIYKSSSYIDYVSYRPRITRVPLASDFVTEYYEFPHNKLPENIKDYIEKDSVFDSTSINLEISNRSSVSNQFHEINYTKTQSVYTIHLNLKTLFYLVSSIYSLEGIEDIKDILSCVKKTLVNTFSYFKNINSISTLEINTRIRYSEEDIVKHIVKFIKLFNEFGQTTGEHIITKDSAFVRAETAYSYFRLTDEDINIASLYIENQDFFVEQYKMIKNNKSRKIIKYKNSYQGEALRKLHDKVAKKIMENYNFTNSSYAYRKGYSILDCVNMHKESCDFFIMDISKFFNSIHYGLLYRVLKNETKRSFVSNREFQVLVKSLMYNNQVPLGYTTSPLVSDIYLHGFDINILEGIADIDTRIIYTRYADDIIFSSPNKFNEVTRSLIEKIVTKELELINLEINRDKVRVQSLENIGDHVKILGLNIVKHTNGNIITVGKKYINDTAKMYLEYLSGVKSNKITGEDKFYLERIISGRVAYIKQIEGETGFESLKNRIKFSTEGRVVINEDLIVF